MRFSTLRLALMLAGTVVVALNTTTTAQSRSEAAVNTTCPISGEPLDGKTSVSYEGKTVGLCCGGCVRAFEAWPAKRKDVYLASFSTPQSRPTSRPASRPAKAAAKDISSLYPFDACPVSGERLGSMGDAIVKTYDGREVRFCCNGCVKPYESDRATFDAKLDRQLIASQMPFYEMALTTCMMTDEPLVEDGKDIAINHVHNNRLIRLCCKACLRGFKRDPQAQLKKLDAAIIEGQRKNYPLDTCVVGGGKLGSMGKPVEVVVANRLVRLCCAGCIDALHKDTPKYISLVDAAWKASGKVKLAPTTRPSR